MITNYIWRCQIQRNNLLKLFGSQSKVSNFSIWLSQWIFYDRSKIDLISKTKHKFDLIDFPVRIISDCDFNFGVVRIIQVMSEVKKVFCGGISHHVSLFNFTIKLFRLNLYWSWKWYFLNYLVSSSSRNLDIKVRKCVTKDWILNVLNFQIKLIIWICVNEGWLYVPYFFTLNWKRFWWSRCSLNLNCGISSSDCIQLHQRTDCIRWGILRWKDHSYFHVF